MSRPSTGSVSPTGTPRMAMRTVIHCAEATTPVTKATTSDAATRSLGTSDVRSTLMPPPSRCTKDVRTSVTLGRANLRFAYRNANANAPSPTKSSPRAASEAKNTDSKWISRNQSQSVAKLASHGTATSAMNAAVATPRRMRRVRGPGADGAPRWTARGG